MNKYGRKAAAIILAATVSVLGFAGCGETKTESSSAASSKAVSSAADTDSSDYDYSAGLTDSGYFEGVTAADYVKLPDYAAMEIPEDVTTVSDEELQSEIDSLMSSYATSEKITDRTVEDGDTVNIDYVGSVDGVEFEGGNTGGAGTTVTIGVTSYIDDFLEQLIGHKPGETFDVNVTFPDPYENNTELSGKDAVFVTTINYIAEETTPELTDEFVAENWQESEGWATAAEAKEAIREEIRVNAVVNYLWSEIQEQAEVSETPDSIFNYHLANMKNYYELVATQYGMEINDFLSTYAGVESMDELIAANTEQLAENAKSSLILQALCEELSVLPTEDDIADFFMQNAGVTDYSDYEEEYGRPYLCLLAREDMVKKMICEGK